MTKIERKINMFIDGFNPQSFGYQPNTLTGFAISRKRFPPICENIV